jgi:hypothetical protein
MRRPNSASHPDVFLEPHQRSMRTKSRMNESSLDTLVASHTNGTSANGQHVPHTGEIYEKIVKARFIRA